jgi:hypothetical protein
MEGFARDSEQVHARFAGDSEHTSAPNMLQICPEGISDCQNYNATIQASRSSVAMKQVCRQTPQHNTWHLALHSICSSCCCLMILTAGLPACCAVGGGGEAVSERIGGFVTRKLCATSSSSLGGPGHILGTNSCKPEHAVGSSSQEAQQAACKAVVMQHAQKPDHMWCGTHHSTLAT